MADHVLGLKLALLGSAFRPGIALARTSVVLLVVGALVAGILYTVPMVRLDDPGHRAALIVVPSTLAFALLLAPLTSGLGSVVEPRRFAAFPLPPVRLARSLALSSIIGPTGFIALVLAVAVETTWSQGIAGGTAAFAGALAVLAILLGGLYLVSIASLLSVSRLTERVITILARVLVGVSIAAAVTTVMVVDRGRDAEWLEATAQTLGVTPLGMLWAAPAVGGAAGAWRLFAGVVMVVALAVGWVAIVRRMLETPERQRESARRTGLGLFDLAPATAGGVIAARSILYWVHDPRYRVALLALPIVPVLMVVVLLIAGFPAQPLWLLPLPVLALFLGWFSHNDVAYDHTALWIHVAADTPGAADRWGRAVPPLLLGIPLLLLAAPLLAVPSGIVGAHPALLGVSVGLLLTGIGVSSVSSALGAYPAARPGAGPFDQPPLTGATAGWAQGLSFFAILAFMSPSIVLAARGALGEPELLGPAGLGGALTGVGILLLGIFVGGAVFRRRGPELLSLAQRG